MVMVNFDQSWVGLVIIIGIQILRLFQCQATILLTLSRITKFFQRFCGANSSQEKWYFRIDLGTMTTFHHGTLLRLNLHCILLMLKIWLNAFDLFKYFTHLNDATNAFALSEYFFSGTALCDMNLLKALMNSLVVWFCINSKLISLIRIHVNSNIYDFFPLRILFLYIIDPEKSRTLARNSFISFLILLFCCWVLY